MIFHCTIYGDAGRGGSLSRRAQRAQISVA